MSESLDRYLKEFKEKIKDADYKFAKDIDLYWEQTIKLFDDDNVSFMKTKPLTFLLALTFLFLFSGSVDG